MKKHTSTATPVDTLMARFEANARAMEAYEPKETSLPSLRTSEPYLFQTVLSNASDLHPNGDTCIEELTDEDLDLPIGFA